MFTIATQLSFKLGKVTSTALREFFRNVGAYLLAMAPGGSTGKRKHARFLLDTGKICRIHRKNRGKSALSAEKPGFAGKFILTKLHEKEYHHLTSVTYLPRCSPEILP